MFHIHPSHSYLLFPFPFSYSLVKADFAAAAVLISLGAVIGKISPTQLLWMTLFEVIIFSANIAFGEKGLKASDVGGSMFIHTFGAYFGMGVSRAITPADLSKEERDADNEV